MARALSVASSTSRPWWARRASQVLEEAMTSRAQSSCGPRSPLRASSGAKQWAISARSSLRLRRITFCMAGDRGSRSWAARRTGPPTSCMVVRRTQKASKRRAKEPSSTIGGSRASRRVRWRSAAARIRASTSSKCTYRVRRATPASAAMSRAEGWRSPPSLRVSRASTMASRVRAARVARPSGVAALVASVADVSSTGGTVRSFHTPCNEHFGGGSATGGHGPASRRSGAPRYTARP